MSGMHFQETLSPSKRRKVRKGTQSCWECKRRKVRCIFASPGDVVCDNCKRRKTTCVSQEHPETSDVSPSNSQVEARLDRVEELLEKVVNNAGATHYTNPPSEDLSGTQSYSVVLDDRDESQLMSVSPITNTPRTLNNGAYSHQEPHSPPISIVQDSDTRTADRYEELTRELVAAWPRQRELDAICNLPVGMSAYLNAKICLPYFNFMSKDPPPRREILRLPPPGSHPVLIARKLLVLGTFIQCVVPSSLQDLEDLGTSIRDVMHRVFDRAIRLVTTNDELVGNIEGIECIMLEAIHHNYAGNIHRAWMATRRATAVAQMMALHRGLKPASLKFLEASTKAAFNPDYLCFRLIQMDRYLSLMLGLPQGLLESRFATRQALSECPPIDRLQRIHCAVCGRILERNDADVKDLAKTLEIDRVLQQAAAEMPPQWWLVPSFTSDNSGGVIMQDTLRLLDQFTHYHLLTRLHLPYMLRSSSDRRYDHSKITAVNVSREILTRYVAFRVSNPADYYCRGTDFLALVAIVVMCLAYIEAHSHSQPQAENVDPGVVFNFLAHSRPSDRGIMERTLDIIAAMTRTGTDNIASKLSRIINYLLSIEANAANGMKYRTSSSKGDDEELESDGRLSDGRISNGGKKLRVYIPYIGTINFERGGVSKAALPAQTRHEQSVSNTSFPDTMAASQPTEPNQPSAYSSQYPPTSQLSDRPVYTNLAAMPPQFGQLSPPEQTPESNEAAGTDNGYDQPASSSQPVEFSLVDDDWDLQGIDVALFDSLFRGLGVPDTMDEDTWSHWGNGNFNL